MKEQNLKQEVSRILQETPSAQMALRDNFINLLNVAEYCNTNYLQSGAASNKALEETKNFASQSLASVAYQISTLANSLLRLLDVQTNQICQMESSINLIGQTVDMHREKIARREIGVSTVVKRFPRSAKITPPGCSEPRVQYKRCAINYSTLDELGHAVKVSGTQLECSGTLRKSGGSTRSIKTPVLCPVPPDLGSVAPPTPPTWQGSPAVESPGDDVVSTPRDQAPPPPDEVTDVAAAPPPPFDVSGELPPPPAPPTSPEGRSDGGTPPAPRPTTPPALETVEEEIIYSLLSLPAPPTHDITANPTNEDLILPAPPPPPINQDVEVLSLTRRSRVRRPPPSTRSLSLRVRSGPASRHRHTHSLFLPTVQSLMIPPPPPYPPPSAPPPLSSSSPRLPACLPARLQHLDLEIPAPPPLLLLDSDGAFDDMMPLPPLTDDITSPPFYLEKVVALYSYTAVKPQDISFTEGDVIYVMHRQDNGWCEGVVNGNRGFFPQNYVQPAS